MVYWISTVEEFIPRFFIFRRIGVLAKRKFTNDPKAAMRYLEVLEKGKILTQCSSAVSWNLLTKFISVMT